MGLVERLPPHLRKNFRFWFWSWHFPGPIGCKSSVSHRFSAKNFRFCLFGKFADGPIRSLARPKAYPPFRPPYYHQGCRRLLLHSNQEEPVLPTGRGLPPSGPDGPIGAGHKQVDVALPGRKRRDGCPRLHLWKRRRGRAIRKRVSN